MARFAYPLSQPKPGGGRLSRAPKRPRIRPLTCAYAGRLRSISTETEGASVLGGPKGLGKNYLRVPPRENCLSPHRTNLKGKASA